VDEEEVPALTTWSRLLRPA